MRHLVVGDGERTALAGIQHVTALLDTNDDRTRLAQTAIEVDRATDRLDAVLREHHDLGTRAGVEVDQVAAHGVELAEGLINPRMLRAEALQHVVKARQIHEA